MEDFDWSTYVKAIDDRRDIVIPGTAEETIEFAVKQFIALARSSYKKHRYFTVALSGGSTPNAIFKLLSSQKYRNAVDWTKIRFFWSDERSVASDHPDSNYRMAMDSGLGSLPIPKENIFRMHAEDNIVRNAALYEEEILRHVPGRKFDLIMLGMGEDGHTASLFPGTEGLRSKGRLVVANYIPSKQTWRMTFTYECIALAAHVWVYAIGKSKATMIEKVLSGSNNEEFPAAKVGSRERKALWILDAEAAGRLLPFGE